MSGGSLSVLLHCRWESGINHPAFPQRLPLCRTYCSPSTHTHTSSGSERVLHQAWTWGLFSSPWISATLNLMCFIDLLLGEIGFVSGGVDLRYATCLTSVDPPLLLGQCFSSNSAPSIHLLCFILWLPTSPLCLSLVFLLLLLHTWICRREGWEMRYISIWCLWISCFVLFFFLQSCCWAREFTQRNLCVWKTKQTAGRGGCWERNSHLLSQVPLCCQFWWNRKNHQSIMDLNLNLCHIFNKLHKYIGSRQHDSQCKTDVWVSSSFLTSLCVFRHQTIKLVRWRAQSQRWTCSALVRWLMLLS